MKLINCINDERVNDLIIKIEHRINQCVDWDIDIRIEMPDNIETHRIFIENKKNNPDEYRKSLAFCSTIYKTIIIRSDLLEKECSVKEFIFAHEIGHIYSKTQRTEIECTTNETRTLKIYENHHPEKFADFFACTWGFFDGLRIARKDQKSYERYIKLFENDKSKFEKDESKFADKVLIY